MSIEKVPIFLDWVCINLAVDALIVDVVVDNDVVEVITEIRKLISIIKLHTWSGIPVLKRVLILVQR